MKLSAVLLARVIYFVESVELNPRGAAYYPDIIKALVERYQFKGFPQKLEEFDESKGVKLVGGKLGDTTIQQLVIFNWGLTLDTTSSTQNSEALLIDALNWAVEHLKLRYSPEMIKRKVYVSQVMFYSDAPLLSLNPVFYQVAERVSREVSLNLKLAYNFQPYGIRLAIDPEQARVAVAPFVLERREAAPFSEQRYFSSAPISTDAHLALIEDIERATLTATVSVGRS